MVLVRVGAVSAEAKRDLHTSLFTDSSLQDFFAWRHYSEINNSNTQITTLTTAVLMLLGFSVPWVHLGWLQEYTHTHTHTRLTALFPGLPPRWAGTRKVKPIWILLKQETVSSSGISWAICKSAPCSRQTTTPAPHHSVFYRPDALPAAQPTASKHWRQDCKNILVKTKCQLFNVMKKVRHLLHNYIGNDSQTIIDIRNVLLYVIFSMLLLP